MNGTTQTDPRKTTQTDPKKKAAGLMMQALIGTGLTPDQVLQIMAEVSATICCGLAFNVNGDHSLKIAALRNQVSVATAMRQAINETPETIMETISMSHYFVAGGEYE